MTPNGIMNLDQQWFSEWPVAWYQAITWIKANSLSINPLGTNVSLIWTKMHNFFSTKM